MNFYLGNSVLNCESNSSIKTLISFSASLNIGNSPFLKNNSLDESQVVKMGPGLYVILSMKNQKIYIGESSNVADRLGRNWNELSKGKHECTQLQLN